MILLYQSDARRAYVSFGWFLNWVSLRKENVTGDGPIPYIRPPAGLPQAVAAKEQ
jgi:hypothetical protein